MNNPTTRLASELYDRRMWITNKGWAIVTVNEWSKVSDAEYTVWCRTASVTPDVYREDRKFDNLVDARHWAFVMANE